MHEILVATDGSAQADRAVEAAAALSKSLGKPLIILSVGNDRYLSDAEREMTEAEYSEIARDLEPVPAEFAALYARNGFPTTMELVEEHGIAVRRVLTERRLRLAEDMARKLGAENVTTEFRLGDPAHQIIDLARRSGVDLIVMGRRGLGGLTGLVLGSVSQKVLHHADVDVLTVP